MGHGTPDYGVRTPISTVYSLEDMGELAVRLGSVVTHDRRGNVIFLEDFENTLNRWQLDGGGEGAAKVISTDRARSGASSCKITLGAFAEVEGTIYHRRPIPGDTGLGVEASILFPTGIDKIHLDMVAQAADGQKQAILRYDKTNDELEIYTPGAGYVVVATTLKLYPVDYYFHTFKVVADFVNNKYIRAIVDHVEYDLSAYDINATSYEGSPRLTVYIRAYNTDAVNRDVYVDDVIITRNES